MHVYKSYTWVYIAVQDNFSRNKQIKQLTALYELRFTEYASQIKIVSCAKVS